MKNTNSSNLDIHFQKIHESIDHLLKNINEDSIPSRIELVQTLFIKQLEKLKFSDVISTTSSTLPDPITKNFAARSNYEKIKNLIESIEDTPESKDEKIELILSMISGMSDNDKIVIKNTFLDLEVDQLKIAILDLISVFVTEDK